MACAELGIGDLLRACVALDVRDEEERRQLRDLLAPELVWKAAAPAPVAPAADATAHAAAPDASRPDARESEPPSDSTTRLVRAVSATKLPPMAPRPTAPIEGRALPQDARAPLALEPLLDPSWTRQILAGLTATETPRGAIDIARLCDAVIELRDIRRIPRTPRPTLRLGVQVLFDRDPSMLVFYADQSALRREIEGLAGSERASFLRCDRFPPARVSELAATRWRAYEPPPAGTPVLLVSDLGMTRAAHPLSASERAAMDRFLSLLRRGDNPLFTLVPHDPASYPPEIRAAFGLLLWDRATRPSDARRTRRSRR